MHAGIQVSMYSGYDLCHPGYHTFVVRCLHKESERVPVINHTILVTSHTRLKKVFRCLVL